jgi:hypothetical protein
MAIALKHILHPAAADPTSRTHRRHPWRTAGVVVVSIFVTLLVLGWIATVVITHTINQRLADMPEYAGHIGQLRVAWWRGGVTMRSLEMWQRGHEADGPVVVVDRGTIAITPSALFRGKLGLHGDFDGVDITMLKTGTAEKPAKSEAEKEAQKQQRLGEVRRWQGSLQKAFPLELTRLELTNSRVRFLDRTVNPNPEMAIEQLHLVLTGLGKKPSKAGDLPAEAQLTGVMSGNGKLVASVQADPTAPQPRFKARTEVQGLSLPPIAPFMRAYAKIEVTKGTFEVYMEANAEGGHYAGYVKPFFRDLEFKPVRDPNQGVLKRVATGAASAFSSLLKNDQQKIATKAPFQGNFADNKVDVWTTVENLFRNAFVQSLGEGLEGQRPSR